MQRIIQSKAQHENFCWKTSRNLCGVHISDSTALGLNLIMIEFCSIAAFELLILWISRLGRYAGTWNRRLLLRFSERFRYQIRAAQARYAAEITEAGGFHALARIAGKSAR